MSRKSKKMKILWAIDPFEQNDDVRKHVLASLREFADRGAEIKPIYVFSPGEYGLSGAEASLPWFKKNEPTLRKVVETYIEDARKESGIPTLLSPQITSERRPSLRRAVETLNTYNRLHGADMIVVGTHSRKGLARFFLGSFAETLLLYSKIPVLVVGAHAKSSKIQKIFFPTDFGKLTVSLFNQVVNLAKTHGASLTLFHVVPRPAEPIIQSGVYLFSGAYMTWPEFVTASEQRHRKSADRFVQIGKKLGVEVTVLFDSQHGSVSASIIEHAQKEMANVIAMGAESGVVASTLIGSVTRQVVRSAPCPVWVVRLKK